MKRTKRLVVGIVVAAVIMLQGLMGGMALAHNAGHIHLPTGECRDVGHGNHGPTENQDKDPELDGDQFGARHAADQGNTPIYPGHCEDPRAHLDH